MGTVEVIQRPPGGRDSPFICIRAYWKTMRKERCEEVKQEKEKKTKNNENTYSLVPFGFRS